MDRANYTIKLKGKIIVNENDKTKRTFETDKNNRYLCNNCQKEILNGDYIYIAEEYWEVFCSPHCASGDTFGRAVSYKDNPKIWRPRDSGSQIWKCTLKKGGSKNV